MRRSRSGLPAGLRSLRHKEGAHRLNQLLVAHSARRRLDQRNRRLDLLKACLQEPVFTGKAVGPTGLGVGLLSVRGRGDRALEEARVFRVARLFVARLDHHRSTFAALVAAPTRQADLLHARRVFYDAQLEAETLLRQLGGERRLEASAILELGAKMTERVSGTLLNLVVSSDPRVKLKPTAEYDDVGLVGPERNLSSSVRHPVVEITEAASPLSAAG